MLFTLLTQMGSRRALLVSVSMRPRSFALYLRSDAFSAFRKEQAQRQSHHMDNRLAYASERDIMTASIDIVRWCLLLLVSPLIMLELRVYHALAIHSHLHPPTFLA